MTDFFTYAIYDRPTDFPNSFPVRKFNWDQPQELLGVAPSLETARLLIPAGCTCIGRAEMDDPNIAEVWI